MKTSKLVLVILTTVLVTALVVGLGFYLYGGRMTQASAEAGGHVHEDGSVHDHETTGQAASGHENEPPAPLMAIVDKVEGKTISGRESATGLPKTFELAADAEIHRQELAQVTDIKPGTPLIAVGPEKEGIPQAEFVLLGEKASFGNRLPLENGMTGGVAAAPAPPEGGSAGGTVAVAPAPSGAAAGAVTGVEPAAGAPQSQSITLAEPVNGTVEQVDGNTLTVKRADGKTVKVEMAANTIIQKYVDAQPSEITPGRAIMMLPALDGEPMRVRILLAAN
jgi:hypothetical protein